jgi:hypothetical protein
MKKMIAALLMFSTTAVIAADVNMNQPVRTFQPGQNICKEWTTARNSKEASQVSIEHEQWLAGFLSGLAMGSGRNILKGQEIRSLFLWMDDYCRANPSNSITDAAKKLATELNNKKN